MLYYQDILSASAVYLSASCQEIWNGQGDESIATCSNAAPPSSRLLTLWAHDTGKFGYQRRSQDLSTYEIVEIWTILASANIVCEDNCQQAGLAEIQVCEVLYSGARGLRHTCPTCATREGAQRGVQLVSIPAALLGQSPCVLQAQKGDKSLTTSIGLQSERDAYQAPPQCKDQ